jgi:hypothetical protein
LPICETAVDDVVLSEGGGTLAARSANSALDGGHLLATRLGLRAADADLADVDTWLDRLFEDRETLACTIYRNLSVLWFVDMEHSLEMVSRTSLPRTRRAPTSILTIATRCT